MISFYTIWYVRIICHSTGQYSELLSYWHKLLMKNKLQHARYYTEDMTTKILNFIYSTGNTWHAWYHTKKHQNNAKDWILKLWYDQIQHRWYNTTPHESQNTKNTTIKTHHERLKEHKKMKLHKRNDTKNTT